MRVIGLVISLCVLALEGFLILRGVQRRSHKFFPLLFAYLVYDFCTTGSTYAVNWLRPEWYASAYWFCYVLSILVEFAVLVEISDHIFQPFPAIRNMGRALTLAVSAAFGISYVLPALVAAQGPRGALLNFALRTSLTKAAILTVLFLAARHFDLRLGKNVAGLMLGFAVYQGINVANLAAARATDPAFYAGVLWIVSPAAYILCLMIWTVALWQVAPAPVAGAAPRASEENSEAVALGLTRFNNNLARFLRR